MQLWRVVLGEKGLEDEDVTQAGISRVVALSRGACQIRGLGVRGHVRMIT